MRVSDRPDPSVWHGLDPRAAIPAAAVAGAGALATAVHLASGAATEQIVATHAGTALLLIALALPPLPWTSVDALRWSTALLALLPLGLGLLGAYAALGVAPLVQVTAAWSGQRDDWSAIPPPLSPVRALIGTTAAIAAIASGGTWAAGAVLGVAASGPGPVELAIAAWIAAPGAALGACGVASVLSLGIARRAAPTVRGSSGR